VLYQKRFIPEEISIQDRHDGQSAEVERQATAATLVNAFETSTIKRRKLIWTSAGIGLGAFGLASGVAFIGGLIKNPWKPVVPTADGLKAVLWTSDWTPRYKGETIYLGRATGRPGESPFTKIRPEDIDAGGMETVFPWRASDGDGTTVESAEKLMHVSMGVRNPVMLIRIKPVDMPRVVKRQGQESFNFGDLFCARATSRSSMHCTSHGPYSDRLRVPSHSCPSLSTKMDTWSPTATSSNPSDRHSGSADHEHERGRPHRNGSRQHRFAVPPRGGPTAPAEQGVPHPLVVPAG
jgi:ubiquinol-cytochrome c reductase iron-sulfur subunit